MGLFDGRGSHGRGVHRARRAVARRPRACWSWTPPRRAGRSPRWCPGSPSFDPEVRLAGVILNRVGSARHEEILRDALAGIGMPVLGALRRDDGDRRPVPAPGPGSGRRAGGRGPPGDRPARRPGHRLRRSGRRGSRSPQSAGPLAAEPWDPGSVIMGSPSEPHQFHDVDERRRAGPGNARLWRSRAGRRSRSATPRRWSCSPPPAPTWSTVDPLRDESLPPGTGALVLGGGFPEVHASELSANEPLRADVARLAAAGAPVAAECAGLLYLASELDGLPMCGVLDADRADDRPGSPSATATRSRPAPRCSHPPGRPSVGTSSTGPPWSRGARAPRRGRSAGKKRASYGVASMRPTCTCTGRGTRSWPGA